MLEDSDIQDIIQRSIRFAQNYLATHHKFSFDELDYEEPPLDLVVYGKLFQLSPRPYYLMLFMSCPWSIKTFRSVTINLSNRLATFYREGLELMST